MARRRVKSFVCVHDECSAMMKFRYVKAQTHVVSESVLHQLRPVNFCGATLLGRVCQSQSQWPHPRIERCVRVWSGGRS